MSNLKNKTVARTHVRELMDLMGVAFSWNKTPPGYHYWKGVFDHLDAMLEEEKETCPHCGREYIQIGRHDDPT